MFKNIFSIIGIIIILCSTSLFGQKQSLSKSEEVFEAFWTVFNENYAFFEEKGVSWSKAYEKYRPLVSGTTGEDELFRIVCEMIKPLNDGHVNLKSPSGKKFSASRPSRIIEEFSKTEGSKKDLYYNMVDSTLYANGFEPLKTIGTKFRGQPLFFYSKNENYGYLRFSRSFVNLLYMKGLFTNFWLEKIFQEFNRKKGLIIDIRFNIGGDDKFSYNLAGRFTEKEFLGHYKQVKNGEAHDEFTDLKAHYVQPKGKTKFLQPIILLTNDKTLSAADVFTLIMNELPKNTIIGENSNGSFSDLYSKKLPNGWKVKLSNQRYLSADKINYEGVGVPVDIEVQNMLSDLENMTDPLIVKALQILDEKIVSISK